MGTRAHGIDGGSVRKRDNQSARAGGTGCDSDEEFKNFTLHKGAMNSPGFVFPILLVLMSAAWYWCLTTQSCLEQMKVLLYEQERYAQHEYIAQGLGQVIIQRCQQQPQKTMDLIRAKGPLCGATSVPLIKPIGCSCSVTLEEEEFLITVSTSHAYWTGRLACKEQQ
jgi:hypothetical protein